jgi:glycosyltransferase involved in cell wall biosynthesis
MSNQIKILFDANPLVKQRVGVGFYTENVIKTIAQEHPAEVSLTGYYFDFLGLSKLEPPQIQGVTYKKIRWFPRKLLSLTRRLGFQIPLNIIIPSTPGYDIVFFPDFVSLPTYLARRVVVIHDICFVDAPQFVRTANANFLKRFVPRSLKSADGVIAVSEFTKERATEIFNIPNGDIVVASPGWVLPNYSKKTLEVSPVLFVGTIEPRKNLQNLLDAYSQLPRAIQDKHPLWLAGGKGWKDDLILEAIEGLKAKQVPIVYKGYVDDQQKAELYDNAAAVVLVSFYEGFGMPILEAMVTNKPLLLSDIDVFHEVAGSSAYYCNPNDSTDISLQLKRILLGSLDMRQKIELYPKLLKEFTWENSANNIVKLFKRVYDKNQGTDN